MTEYGDIVEFSSEGWDDLGDTVHEKRFGRFVKASRITEWLVFRTLEDAVQDKHCIRSYFIDNGEFEAMVKSMTGLKQDK
jgi:hypothetical protein